MAEKIVAVNEAVGSGVAFVDIGGGLPCSEDITDEELQSLVKTLGQFFGPDIEIISEAGRFLVESAMSLMAEIISVKRIDDIRYDVSIDTNICHVPCYWQRKYDIAFQPQVPGAQQPALLSVYGNSCMQMDCFAERFPVDQAPRTGDRLRLSRMGAYSLSQASPFITEMEEVRSIAR